MGLTKGTNRLIDSLRCGVTCAVHCAAMQGYTDLCDLLIRHQANIDFASRDGSTSTPNSFVSLHIFTNNSISSQVRRCTLPCRKIGRSSFSFSSTVVHIYHWPLFYIHTYIFNVSLLPMFPTRVQVRMST